jgi:UrcA family protein
MFTPEQTESARKRATLIILALITTSLGVGTVSPIFADPAHAATEGEVRTRIVRYGDLNLASKEGRDTLDRRIRRAAKAVCSAGSNLPLGPYSRMKACTEATHRNAWAIAEQRIDNYRLAVRMAN